MNVSTTPYLQAEKEKEYKQEWEASADIRAEFGGNYEVYKAFRAAQDNGQLPSDQRPQRRLTLAQLEELVKLRWDTEFGLRSRYTSFEAYSGRMFFDEVLGTKK